MSSHDLVPAFRQLGEASPAVETNRAIRQQYFSSRAIGDYMTAGLSSLGLMQLTDFPINLLDSFQDALKFHELDDGRLLMPLKMHADGEANAFLRHRTTRPPWDNLSGPRSTVILVLHSHLTLRIFEVAARTPQNLDMLLALRAGPTYMDEMVQIESRHEVETLVSLRSIFEPRWLPSLVLRDRRNLDSTGPERTRHVRWPSILRTTCAAPILRVLVREGAGFLLPKVAKDI